MEQIVDHKIVTLNKLEAFLCTLPKNAEMNFNLPEECPIGRFLKFSGIDFICVFYDWFSVPNHRYYFNDAVKKLSLAMCNLTNSRTDESDPKFITVQEVLDLMAGIKANNC